MRSLHHPDGLLPCVGERSGRCVAGKHLVWRYHWRHIARLTRIVLGGCRPEGIVWREHQESRCTVVLQRHPNMELA